MNFFGALGRLFMLAGGGFMIFGIIYSSLALILTGGVVMVTGAAWTEDSVE